MRLRYTLPLGTFYNLTFTIFFQDPAMDSSTFMWSDVPSWDLSTLNVAHCTPSDTVGESAWVNIVSGSEGNNVTLVYNNQFLPQGQYAPLYVDVLMTFFDEYAPFQV
jgi:hypothetical protein